MRLGFLPISMTRPQPRVYRAAIPYLFSMGQAVQRPSFEASSPKSFRPAGMSR